MDKKEIVDLIKKHSKYGFEYGKSVKYFEFRNSSKKGLCPD